MPTGMPVGGATTAGAVPSTGGAAAAAAAAASAAAIAARSGKCTSGTLSRMVVPAVAKSAWIEGSFAGTVPCMSYSGRVAGAPAAEVAPRGGESALTSTVVPPRTWPA